MIEFPVVQSKVSGQLVIIIDDDPQGGSKKADQITRVGGTPKIVTIAEAVQVITAERPNYVSFGGMLIRPDQALEYLKGSLPKTRKPEVGKWGRRR